MDFYPSKIKVFSLLIISFIFSFAGIYFFDELISFEEKVFKSIILLLGILLFLFGIVFSILLLIRIKPLLSITEKQIIIHNPLINKQRIIYFNEIESFFIVSTYHKGFVKNRQIFVEMKNPTQKYSKSWLYKFLKRINLKMANSQYGIQTSLLNINHNKLLNILNEKLEKQ